MPVMERPVADATDSLCPMSALWLFPPSKIATKNKQFNNFIFGDKIINAFRQNNKQ